MCNNLRQHGEKQRWRCDEHREQNGEDEPGSAIRDGLMAGEFKRGDVARS
jgi:hypothetical protein